ASYVSGEVITVKVTLKDAAGNAVPGQTASLKDVKVPNAEPKGAWSETPANSGVYTATYTAQTVGTDLKAKLTLDGWTESSISDAYAITAGVAGQASSSVLVDGSSFVSGSDMTVSVSLLDAQGNPVIGQANSLKDAVTVPNATLSSAWTDNRDGT